MKVSVMIMSRLFHLEMMTTCMDNRAVLYLCSAESLQIEKLSNYVQFFILSLHRILMRKSCHLVIHICEEGVISPCGYFSLDIWYLISDIITRNTVLTGHVRSPLQFSFPAIFKLKFMNQASCSELCRWSRVWKLFSLHCVHTSVKTSLGLN